MSATLSRGLSRRSVARWLAWLRARGLLGVVESGWTPLLSPLALDADVPNRAAVYVLCEPDQPSHSEIELELEVPAAGSGGSDPASYVDRTGTLTHFVVHLGKNPYPGARARRPTAGAKLAHERRSEEPEGKPWKRVAVAGSRRDRLALVARLQNEAPALRACSAAALRSVLRPWLDRPELGWSVAELLYAIDHTPAGQLHPFTTPVRVPARWLAHRMAAWRDQHGHPLRAPRLMIAEARAATLEAATAARTARAEQDQRITAEHAFGRLVRAAAGPRYPALVHAVLTGQPPAQPARARLLPDRAADALVRCAVRALTGTDDTPNKITAAVNHLIDGSSGQT